MRINPALSPSVYRLPIVARIAQGQPDFEPDARHLYSNAGYILLGYIAGKVGGKPCQEALKERITSKNEREDLLG